MPVRTLIACLALAALAAPARGQGDSVAAPTALAIDSADRVYTLRWSYPASEQHGFLVYADTAAGPVALIEQTGSEARSMVLEATPFGRPYYVRVKAVHFGTKRQSAFSEPVTFTGAPYFSRHPQRLKQYFYGMLRWGDVDVDGDLDLLILGNGAWQEDTAQFAKGSALYRNQGGVLVPEYVDLPRPMSNGAMEFGDYDNDGDPDLVVAGCCRPYPEQGGFAYIYRNDGGRFVKTADSLLGGQQASASWGDYDNDADLDLLLSLTDEQKRTTRIYRNDSGSFRDSGIPFPEWGGYLGQAAFLDFDSDGDLDVSVLTGRKEGTPPPGLFLNDGKGGFTLRDTLTGGGASIAWADYDRDGDLDGLAGTQILRNDSGRLATVSMPFTGQFSHWVDINQDGKLDVASGSHLHLATDSGFARLRAPFPLYYTSGSSWGDFDIDGDLDLALTETDRMEGGVATRIYLNNGILPGRPKPKRTARSPGDARPPGAPAGLAHRSEGGEHVFSWEPPAGSAPSTRALTYALAIGTAPGKADVLSPSADPADGFRYLPAHGNVYMNRRWAVRGLKPGRYHWSVQAVDQDLEGSRFAAWREFEVEPVALRPGGAASRDRILGVRRLRGVEATFELGAGGEARLTLHDSRGRQVGELRKSGLAPGRHTLRLDAGEGRDIRLYRLRAGKAIQAGMLAP